MLNTCLSVAVVVAADNAPMLAHSLVLVLAAVLADS